MKHSKRRNIVSLRQFILKPEVNLSRAGKLSAKSSLIVLGIKDIPARFVMLFFRANIAVIVANFLLPVTVSQIALTTKTLGKLFINSRENYSPAG